MRGSVIRRDVRGWYESQVSGVHARHLRLRRLLAGGNSSRGRTRGGA